MSDDPVRLRDDSAAPPALRSDLRAFAAWSAPFDMARAAARLDTHMQSGATSGSFSRNAKWWGLAAIGLASLVATVTYAAWHPSPHVADVPPVAIGEGAGHASSGSAAHVANGSSNAVPPAPVPSTSSANEPLPSSALANAPGTQLPTAGPSAAGVDSPSTLLAPALDLAAGAAPNVRLAPRASASLADRLHGPLPAAPATAPRAARTTAPATPPTGAPTSVSDLFGDREHEQLTYAYAELSRNPARALALADAGQRAYPSSAHVEEREALAIQALARLRRWPEVRDRAQRFLQRYPHGPYSGTIRQIAGQSAMRARQIF